MDDEFVALEINQLAHHEVAGDLKISREKRGAISVAKFRIIGDLVWTKQHSVEQSSHYNDTYNVRL